MRQKIALVASLILLAGCASNGAAPVDCGPWRPIRVHPIDVMMEETARQILVHNETGKALCGWSPNVDRIYPRR